MRYLLVSILMLFSLIVNAQDARQNTLKLIYIYHTPNTPVAELCVSLSNAFNDARNYGIPTIFYLASMDNPYIALAGMGETAVEEYEIIINRLQERRFHSIDPHSDVERLIEMFNDCDFLADTGRPKYNSMIWSFYVNQDYWDANYNEQIIAKLYYALELGKLPSDYLHFQVYYSGTDEFHYDTESPLGDKIYCPELKSLELIKF